MRRFWAGRGWLRGFRGIYLGEGDGLSIGALKGRSMKGNGGNGKLQSTFQETILSRMVGESGFMDV